MACPLILIPFTYELSSVFECRVIFHGHLLEGFCPTTDLKGSVTFALAMMWFSVAV